MCLGCRQGRAALSLEDAVELPRHLDLSVRGKDWDKEERKEDKGEKGSIVEVVAKSLLDILTPPTDDAAADAEASSDSSSPAASAPSLRVPPSQSAESSPVAIPALASSALRSLSPRSLLACISSPMFVDPLSPLSLDPSSNPSSLPPSAPSTPPSAPPSTNISVAQNVIMDTDNNDVMRALVAVFRHADRTPKQKVKLISKSRQLLELFRQKTQPAKKKEGGTPAPPPATPTGGAGGAAVKFVEIKFKRKEELAQLLHIVKVMIVKEKVRNRKRVRAEQERAALAASTLTLPVASPSSSSAELLGSPCTAAAAAKVEERKEESEGEASDGELSDDGTSSAADDGEDFEQAVEREMLDKERKEREKDPDYLSKLLQVKTVLERGYVGAKLQVKPKKVDNGRVVQVLLVCKWGGEMTHAGFGQARQYAAAFWDDVCPPPPIPASFFIQSKEQQQGAHKEEAEKKMQQQEGQAAHAQSVPASPASGAFLSPLASSTSVPGTSPAVTPSLSRGGEGDDHSAHVMVDHNNTLDRADRDRYKKLLLDVQQLKDKRTSAAPHLNDSLAAPTPSTTSSTPDSASLPAAAPSLSPSPPPSFTDTLKSGLSRLFRVPSAIISTHRTPSLSTSHPQLVNTSVSDTAAASAVVNPLLQRRELERYREKQAQFEKQRLDFIHGMQVYSSDEARVVASAKAFYMSTMEHAHGIGDHHDHTQPSASSSATLPSSSGGHLNLPGTSTAQAQLIAQAKRLKESGALMAALKAAAEKSIHHDAAVLSYLDDTSMAAESMARAKEGVKFLLMAENAFTPAQVTRHMLAVEQIARATSEAERSRIEKEEEDQLKKAKEEAEVREKEEKIRAERKKKEQKLQEREERMQDELAMREEDPVTAATTPLPSVDHHFGDAGQGSNGADAAERREKERDYKKRPSALSSTALPSSFPSPCSSPHPTPTAHSIPAPISPPPYSPPPSPSSFEPNAMTAWGVRCLRWVGKPRDTLHHLYHLLKQLQTQIHSKCEFADKAQRFKQQSQEGERTDHASASASTTASASATAADDAATPAATPAASPAASSPSGSGATLAPAPPSSSQRPRRLSIGGGGSIKAGGGGGGGGGGDVFEYVFEAGDEEIVGHHHKILKQAPRRFAADHLLCHGETLFLLKTRWDRLISAFYDPVSRSFDPTKIPDVYDCNTTRAHLADATLSHRAVPPGSCPLTLPSMSAVCQASSTTCSTTASSSRTCARCTRPSRGWRTASCRRSTAY